MAWLILILAGALEVAWAYGLKKGAGLDRPLLGIATVAAMIASVWLLAIAMRSLPLGTAYAIWTGIGAVGSVLVGILVMGESASPARLLCVSLILGGIVGLKLTSEG